MVAANQEPLGEYDIFGRLISGTLSFNGAYLIRGNKLAAFKHGPLGPPKSWHSGVSMDLLCSFVCLVGALRLHFGAAIGGNESGQT